MVDPATLGAVGMGLDVGGTLLSAFGTKQKGESRADMYSYQAGIADMRRRIALQNRDFAIQQGGQESIIAGFKSRTDAANIEAAQSASGIAMDSGSSVAVRKGQRVISDMDLSTVINNAARRAYGYETEAAYEGAQGDLYREAASRTRDAIPMELASTLISGASSVSSKWLQGRQVGLWAGDETLGA